MQIDQLLHGLHGLGAGQQDVAVVIVQRIRIGLK